MQCFLSCYSSTMHAVRMVFVSLAYSQSGSAVDRPRSVAKYWCLPCAEEVRKDRKKATKHDAAHRLASVLHVEGRDGVEAEYEKSEAFHDAWRLKSRDMLARAEFRRRKLVQRLQVRIHVASVVDLCLCLWCPRS